MKKNMPSKILIGEVCRLANCTPRTVRHYEQENLFVPVEKTSGGHKLYDINAVSIIQTAQLLKRLGYSLKDVRQIIRLAKSKHTQNRTLSKKLRKLLLDATVKMDSELRLLSSSRKRITDLLEETRKCEACKSSDCGKCGKLEHLRTLGLIGS